MTGPSFVQVDALGVTVRIDVPDSRAHLVETLERLWRRCATDQDVEVDVVLDLADIGDDIADAEILEALTQHVTVEAIGVRAGDDLMLHACAIAADDGRALAFVGPSGVGKTTLAHTLGRRWAYVTDETVAVTGSGVLRSYPKPLSLVDPERPKRQMAPDELELLAAPADLRLVATVLLDRVPGLASAQVEPVPLVEALGLAAPHTSHLGELEAPLHRLASALGDQVWTARYSEVDQLVPHVVAVLGAPSVGESR